MDTDSEQESYVSTISKENSNNDENNESEVSEQNAVLPNTEKVEQAENIIPQNTVIELDSIPETKNNGGNEEVALPNKSEVANQGKNNLEGYDSILKLATNENVVNEINSAEHDSNNNAETKHAEYLNTVPGADNTTPSLENNTEYKQAKEVKHENHEFLNAMPPGASQDTPNLSGYKFPDLS